VRNVERCQLGMCHGNIPYTAWTLDIELLDY
jgi:hypothetical protein